MLSTEKPNQTTDDCVTIIKLLKRFSTLEKRFQEAGASLVGAGRVPVVFAITSEEYSALVKYFDQGDTIRGVPTSIEKGAEYILSDRCVQYFVNEATKIKNLAYELDTNLTTTKLQRKHKLAYPWIFKSMGGFTSLYGIELIY